MLVVCPVLFRGCHYETRFPDPVRPKKWMLSCPTAIKWLRPYTSELNRIYQSYRVRVVAPHHLKPVGVSDGLKKGGFERHAVANVYRVCQGQGKLRIELLHLSQQGGVRNINRIE